MPLPSEIPPPSACHRIERMIVHKGERRLWALCAGGAVVSLPVALGRGLPGPKRSQGDQRTPEGDYRVVGAPKSSRFHRFVAIDYPSPGDADRALAEARISRAEHARIVDAHRRGVLPPFDTPLGGDIGFHGEGERWRGESHDLDWTFGCIALSDSDLDFLIAHAPAGTPLSILGTTAPVPPDLADR
ncbi:MAG: L,D-transpeptidase family protein [Myxococcota bacterium]